MVEQPFLYWKRFVTLSMIKKMPPVSKVKPGALLYAYAFRQIAGKLNSSDF